MNRGLIVIVPSFEKGKGGGHLCRCIALTRDLRASGRQAFLFLPEQDASLEQDECLAHLFQSMNFDPAWRVTKWQTENESEKTEIVIMDNFQTTRDELLRWKKIAPVAGIDEGGKWRDSFDFLIDILVPEKLGRPPANITKPSLLNFPQKQFRKKNSKDALKVLVTFGQEDSAGLGPAIARSLSAKNAGSMEITLLRGALAKSGETEYPANVRVTGAIPSLAEHLGEYDLVITHYGITAYEALYSGTPVILASPTAYHAKLAKAAGFYPWLNSLNLNFLEKLKKHCEKLAVKYGLDTEGESLASLCGGFSPLVNRRCPVCGADVPEQSVSRFADRTYRRCSNCGVIFMDRTGPAPIEYEREYFFESYKRQYGKTYLEDFDNIKASGIRRLEIIKSLLPSPTSTRTLLDIGCAYGPFLAAAREEGFSPSGIDPAQDAVRYVTQELKLPAVQGFFPNSPLPDSDTQTYSAVTLWFVIEHFTDCAAVLAAIKKILASGGILAFSTPSFSGVSGRACLRRFLEASPADHFTVWSPEMCKKALAFSGFKVKKTASIGHHPERFPLLGKFAKSKKSPLYWPLLAISKIFKLGDTFEVYAQV